MPKPSPDNSETTKMHNARDELTQHQRVSVFAIPKMDCPSEERLIRTALADITAISALSFDLANRNLTVLHTDDTQKIENKLAPLKLGAALSSTRDASKEQIKSMMAEAAAAEESHTLHWLLGINVALFLLEFTAGFIAESTGLIGESLDNFADAAVYGLALYAVGRSVKMQLKAAHLAGILQLILAIGVLEEVIRRLIYGSTPESTLMMVFAFIALLANSACMALIFKHRQGGAHMRASWIFSTNDVVINLGVIAAAALVGITGSHYPDLIIGTITGLLVLNGARRILALKN